MPKKKLHKSIQTYFSKQLKKIRTPSTTSLLSSCKYPRTSSFPVDAATSPAHHCISNTTAAATLSDVDRFLFENFNSLYIQNDEVEPPTTTAEDDAIKPCRRFFMSASASTSSALSSHRESPSTVALGGMAVMTLSKEPYDDFLRSMKEMVQDNNRTVIEVEELDWDFMEELLFCYLELNDRSVHKHILRAFTDLTVSFRNKTPSQQREENSSDCKFHE